MSSVDECQVQPESIEQLTSLMLAMFNSLDHSIKKKVKFDVFPSPLSCGNSLVLRLHLRGAHQLCSGQVMLISSSETSHVSWNSACPVDLWFVIEACCYGVELAARSLLLSASECTHCLGSRAFNNIFTVICQLMYTFSYGNGIQQGLYCHLTVDVHIVMGLGHWMGYLFSAIQCTPCVVARAFNEVKLFVSRCTPCVVARAFNEVKLSVSRCTPCFVARALN